MGREGSRALNQQPILSQVIQLWNGGPTDVLFSKALNPEVAQGGAYTKTKTTHSTYMSHIRLWLWLPGTLEWQAVRYRMYSQHACFSKGLRFRLKEKVSSKDHMGEWSVCQEQECMLGGEKMWDYDQENQKQEKKRKGNLPLEKYGRSMSKKIWLPDK